jgi:hypothetical protein
MPTDVHVDLPDAFVSMRNYVVSKFESSDPDATLPASVVTFSHEDGVLVVAVNIRNKPEAAVYTANIVDKQTGVAYGTIRISVKSATAKSD